MCTVPAEQTPVVTSKTGFDSVPALELADEPMWSRPTRSVTDRSQARRAGRNNTKNYILVDHVPDQLQDRVVDHLSVDASR